jgi:hypothetical protein
MSFLVFLLTSVDESVARNAVGSIPSSWQNPNVDFDGYIRVATAVQGARRVSLISDEQFLAYASEPNTIVLDARSERFFEMFHIRGAKNLPLPDFSEISLARVIPSKTNRILIYCNNNFLGVGEAMVSKLPSASLNIATFTTLAVYGYTDVFELGTFTHVRDSTLPFEDRRVETE